MERAGLGEVCEGGNKGRSKVRKAFEIKGSSAACDKGTWCRLAVLVAVALPTQALSFAAGTSATHCPRARQAQLARRLQGPLARTRMHYDIRTAIPTPESWFCTVIIRFPIRQPPHSGPFTSPARRTLQGQPPAEATATAPSASPRVPTRHARMPWKQMCRLISARLACSHFPTAATHPATASNLRGPGYAQRGTARACAAARGPFATAR